MNPSHKSQMAERLSLNQIKSNEKKRLEGNQLYRIKSNEKKSN